MEVKTEMDEKKYIEKKVEKNFINASILIMSFVITFILRMCADLSFIEGVSVFCLTAIFFWVLPLFLALSDKYQKEE